MSITLSKMEKKFEELLVKSLAGTLGMSTESVEELVVLPKNRQLKGGEAVCMISRVTPTTYRGYIETRLPCPTCQEKGATFRLCQSPRVCGVFVDHIPIDDVNPAHYLSVEDKPREVMRWTW